MVDFKKLAKHISVAGVEDLKASRETFNDNLFSSFLRKLKRSMSTHGLNMPGSLLHADRMTPESDASDSSNEDKEEEVSRLCIGEFMEAILDVTGISRVNGTYRFGWCVVSITIP